MHMYTHSHIHKHTSMHTSIHIHSYTQHSQTHVVSLSVFIHHCHQSNQEVRSSSDPFGGLQVSFSIVMLELGPCWPWEISALATNVYKMHWSIQATLAVAQGFVCFYLWHIILICWISTNAGIKYFNFNLFSLHIAQPDFDTVCTLSAICAGSALRGLFPATADQSQASLLRERCLHALHTTQDCPAGRVPVRRSQ